MGDRIEAFTYMVAAAITEGDLILDGIDFKHTLKKPIEILKQIGVGFDSIIAHNSFVSFSESDALPIAMLSTEPTGRLSNSLRKSQMQVLEQS